MLYDRREAKMKIHIGPETSLFWDTSTSNLYVARAERFPVGNFLVSMILVCVGSVLISCGLLWFWVPAGYSTTRKEWRKYVWAERGDVYFSLDMQAKNSKWRRVVPCSSLRNELHKRGMCRSAILSLVKRRKFSWGRTVVCWKVRQPPNTQLSFWTPAVNAHLYLFAYLLTKKKK
jgi:hypothetical protein